MHEGAAAPSIAHDLQARARPFLDLVDGIRKDGVHNTIKIPQIAVMGDQSSGKSSVLEAISGIQFPRGTGLVTRCATQITMSQGPEWSAELHAAGEVRVVKVGGEDELGRHIEELTDKLRGDEEFCDVDKLIEIKLKAPDAPDLTIIDLPGIVRTSTAGQTDAVRVQVDKLLEYYLHQARTIILAVIPCNVDIATVDILERASRADPGFFSFSFSFSLSLSLSRFHAACACMCMDALTVRRSNCASSEKPICSLRPRCGAV